MGGAACGGSLSKRPYEAGNWIERSGKEDAKCVNRISLVMGLGDDYHCCTSCHEDEDMGYYNILEQYDGDDFVSYCCGLAGVIESENIPWDKLRARMN